MTVKTDRESIIALVSDRQSDIANMVLALLADREAAEKEWQETTAILYSALGAEIDYITLLGLAERVQEEISYLRNSKKAAEAARDAMKVDAERWHHVQRHFDVEQVDVAIDAARKG
jgi:hypothetical protein